MVGMLPTAVLLAVAVSVVAKDNATCDAPCGLRFRQNPPGSGRIVRGQDATIGAWPWMASLQVFTSHNNRRYHACGGTLLNSHWLLTAAHCFLSKKKVYDWRLIFGAREIVYGNDKPAKPPQQERYVEKIIIHEKYIPSLEHNDIALMKITPPVPCGQFTSTGCLPQFRAGPPRVPQARWVAGWGFLKEKAYRIAPTLQEARVKLINLDLCNSTQWYNGRIRSTNVCARYPEGKINTCQLCGLGNMARGLCDNEIRTDVKLSEQSVTCRTCLQMWALKPTGDEMLVRSQQAEISGPGQVSQVLGALEPCSGDRVRRSQPRWQAESSGTGQVSPVPRALELGPWGDRPIRSLRRVTIRA
ncbi:PREDICTED: acrosin-like [Odobenus rosmarus divergens]|uniref:Acrosin-like n=2 Tax=Odobenus rosmarus divergens TaxID=9708 RepID=A0A9B0HG64_ODORO